MDKQGRPSSHGKLARVLIDPHFRSRLVRYCLGLPTPLDTEDRRVLEQVIFKHYCAQPDIRTVLFVGVDWYTKHYEKQYFSDKTFWTIDVLPSARRFGAKRHLICALEDLEPHFAAEYFDLIVCSGVYGFGLNTRSACERAFDTCYTLLRTGGHFVLGWNDVRTDAQCSLAEIDSLRRFRPRELPALGAHRYLTHTPLRHIYQFFDKASP